MSLVSLCGGDLVLGRSVVQRQHAEHHHKADRQGPGVLDQGRGPLHQGESQLAAAVVNHTNWIPENTHRRVLGWDRENLVCHLQITN